MHVCMDALGNLVAALSNTRFINITRSKKWIRLYTYRNEPTTQQNTTSWKQQYYERGKKEYLIRDVCFCLPTGRRRACFKRRRLGILANLKRCVDLEKGHMEMSGRYFTLFYFITNSSKVKHELSWSTQSYYVWLHLVGYEQTGWTVLCCEENTHQKSLKGWLHEGGPSVFCQ